MRPMLGDLELPQVQQVITIDRRSLAAHTVAGHDATVLQNLGRHATRILVTGVATGEQAQQLAQRLDDALREGAPRTFVADVTADAELEHVVVTDVSLTDLAGHPDRVAYHLTLSEYTEPPAPPDPTAAAAGIADEAAALVQGLTLGLDGAAAFAAALTRATTTFGDLLTRIQRVGEAAGKP
jgi:hypothetical protein